MYDFSELSLQISFYSFMLARGEDLTEFKPRKEFEAFIQQMEPRLLVYLVEFRLRKVYKLSNTSIARLNLEACIKELKHQVGKMKRENFLT